MISEYFEYQHNAVTLFYQDDVDLESALDWSVDCLRQIGLTPNALSSSIDRKVASFSSRLKRYRRMGLANLTDICIMAIPEHLNLDPGSGFAASISFNNGMFGLATKSASVNIRSNIVPANGFDDICLRLTHFSRPCYGCRRVCPGAFEIIGGLEFFCPAVS